MKAELAYKQLTAERTSYEWTAEEVDEHEDIIDSHFDECLKDLLRQNPDHRIGLVKTIGSHAEGVTDRTWAYLDASGKLPAEFEDGTLIPKRFYTEASKMNDGTVP